MDEDDEELCQHPCQPGTECTECDGYWARMRYKGFWNDATGWTDKALKEWLK